MSTVRKHNFTRREAFQFHKTLLCLVKALENRCTTIDLKNEISVTGKIVEVDGCMNITLSESAVFDTDGEYRYFPLMYIQSRNIRFVHIPDNVSIKKTIKSQLVKEKQTEQKKLTFKQSRAMKNHLETLKLIEEMKKQKQAKAGSQKN